MQQPQPSAPKALPHQRFWRWFRSRSARVQIISCVALILSCSLCTFISYATSGTPLAQIAATPISTDTPTQRIATEPNGNAYSKTNACTNQSADNHAWKASSWRPSLGFLWEIWQSHFRDCTIRLSAKWFTRGECRMGHRQ